jgi:hypothetical protein
VEWFEVSKLVVFIDLVILLGTGCGHVHVQICVGEADTRGSLREVVFDSFNSS